MTNTTAYRVARVIAECLWIDQDLLPAAATALALDSMERLATDSLDQIEIGMALEDEFELEEIPDDDIASCKSLGDWTDLIVRKLAAKAAA